MKVGGNVTRMALETVREIMALICLADARMSPPESWFRASNGPTLDRSRKPDRRRAARVRIAVRARVATCSTNNYGRRRTKTIEY